MKHFLATIFIFLICFVFVGTAKAADCGCHTPTPKPVPTSTPTPSPIQTSDPASTSTPSDGNNSLSPAGAPICTATVPSNPIVTSIVRKPTSATLIWIAVANANHYMIFFGNNPGSQQFGVPDTGNVTTYTINALNPKLKYYFDVRAVNDCMPSAGSDGQVLGASTSVLADTSSDLLIPRTIFAIIAASGTFLIKKRFNF